MLVEPPANAKLIAELQAVAVAVRVFGLRRLPDVVVTPPAQGDD